MRGGAAPAWTEWYVLQASAGASEATAERVEQLRRRDLSSLVARARERRAQLDSSSNTSPTGATPPRDRPSR